MEFPPRKQKVIDKLFLIITIAFCLFIFSERTTLADCMEIDDEPVEVQVQGAPANIMFLVDDRKSIDYEVSTTEGNSMFNNNEYLYGIPGDYIDVNSSGDDSDNYVGSANILGDTLADRGMWNALWHGYNKIYYNPSITYTPWPTINGSMSDANKDTPWSHPIDQNFQITLNDPYHSVAYTDSSGNPDTLPIPVSHYYVKDNSGNLYLVTIPGSSGSYDVNYYSVTVDSADGVLDIVEDNQIVIENNPPAEIVTARDDTAERQNFANWFTYYRRRQLMAVNAIANTLMEVNGVNIGFAATKPMQDTSFSPGDGYTDPTKYFTAADGGVVTEFLQPVVSVDTYKSELLNKLYTYRAGINQTSGFIRRSLEEIGFYYETEYDNNVSGSTDVADTNLGPSPITETCQQNFVIVFNDGAYEGGAPNDSQNWDGEFSKVSPDQNDAKMDLPIYKEATNPITNLKEAIVDVKPYADHNASSMADQAMRWYIQDLAPKLDDNVPTNDVDWANWQHMVTYTVVFGEKGTLKSEEEAFDIFDSTTYPAYVIKNNEVNNCSPWCWPDIGDQDDGVRIDDMWHAAVNGRGLFFAAGDPEALKSALMEVINNIKDRIGASGASVSVSSNELVAGTKVFQSKYTTKGWSGDVYAYEMQSDGKWSLSLEWDEKGAGEILDAKDKSTRNIGTYSGTGGIEFIGDINSTLTSEMVSYLRGVKTNEAENGGPYRDRLTTGDTSFTLGDVVHSSPVYFKDVLYVGANDGMLHAFRAVETSSGARDAGQELFAYVPSFVHSTIAELADPSYSHKYYVDQSATIETVSTTSGDTTTYTDILVGGLGKGGKGYFALDVSTPTGNTGPGASNWVKWEFPRDKNRTAEADDIGYSFSRPWIVKSYDPTHPWVVVFGNGYDSTNEEAILYVLDAFTGDVISKIQTGVFGCNGLSTPIPVDVDDDQVMDYVYAGDLKGNLWKFNMKATTASGWGNAFGTKPLFSQSQPITTRPDVMRHCGKHGYLVFFGTGKLLSYDIDVDSDDHRVYGIWDFSDDEDSGEYLGELTETYDANGDLTSATVDNMTNMYVELFKHDVAEYDINGTSVRVIGTPGSNPNWATVDDNLTTSTAPGSFNTAIDNTGTLDYQPNPEGTSTNTAHVGWFFDLPDDNERIIIDVQVRAGILYVVSSAPGTQEICASASGKSWLMAVDACTGGIMEELVWDIEGDGTLDDGDYVNIGTVDNPILVPASGFQPDGNVVGITFTEEDVIVSYEDPSSGTGGAPFGTMPVPPVNPAFLFWRQIE